MSQSHGLTQFKTANIIKSKCVHITNLSPLLSEMFDEIQTPMINIQKCQDYVFNYNDHYSYAELTNIKQTVNDEIMYILNSNIYDYRQQLAHMKKANPKLLQFENLNISFQIARYKRFDISFEELSHIIPSEFLPEPEIVKIVTKGWLKQSKGVLVEHNSMITSNFRLRAQQIVHHKVLRTTSKHNEF
ncbi:Hypothetical_protein [Hexamita inflata]|uniref:Hypothetical_protein n=1 Tax=Hexamita inflata TaxID=28002 RepID=A0AA86PT05_9EUKA|nr:Hypothetical protein HINF_LOCUS31871 [Hexamita inflata]